MLIKDRTVSQEKVGETVEVLGCPITKLSLENVVPLAEEFVGTGKPHYIAVVNVAKVMKMRSDNELEQSVRSADIKGADGVPLVRASRLLGNPMPGRVNGTDLMYRLLERANERGYRGVGGSFDVLAGVIPRAPLWM